MWSALKCLAEALPVRPMSSDCACDSQRHDKTRAVVHPEGWDVTCLKCGERWVEWQLREAFTAAHR